MTVSEEALRLAEEYQTALWRVTPQRYRREPRWEDLSHLDQTLMAAAFDQLLYLGEQA